MSCTFALAFLALRSPLLAASPPGPVALGSHSAVRIHEFLAVNDGGLLDEDGDDSDWIEIHNATAGPIDLAGWHLTDDPADGAKWTFPSAVVPAGGFLVVFASDKDRALVGGELHTNFKLTSGGEYLALLRPNGTTVASQYWPAYPPQSPNVSYGLRDTFLDEGYLAPPTPGGPNGDLFAPLPRPTFSVRRGLFDAPFDLALANAHPAATILYTLDGSDPADPAVAPSVYAGTIHVDRTRIVRAFARKAGHADSRTRTHTFVFPAHVLTQSDARAIADGFPAQWVEDDGTEWSLGGTRPGAWYGYDRTILATYTQSELEAALAALPSVSLAMHPEDWFGDATAGQRAGIYCNSEDSGSAWDRPGSLEWIDPSGGPQVQVDCGLAIQGGSNTGEALRNQLSIALKFQAEFGAAKLHFPVYPDSPVEEFDYLILDGGNQNAPNGVGDYTKKRHAQGTRDAFMNDLQRAFGGLAPLGRYVHLYLDGLYWGVFDLHERIDHRGAAAHQGGEPEEYDYVKEGSIRFGNPKPWNDPNTPGAWSTAVEIAKNGLAPGDLWQGSPAYEAFQEWFDVADYADYLLLNYNGGNTDWPQNNWMGTSHARLSADFADVNPDNPGWRWHSWDAETVLHWGGAEFAVGDGYWDRTGLTSTWSGSVVYFYTYLRENPEWRLLLADRAYSHLSHGALRVDPGYANQGTPFDPEHPERNRPAALYHRLSDELASAVMMEYARWGNYWNAPGTITPADWADERGRLLEDYFPIRSGVLLAQLRNVQPQLYPDLDAPVLEPWGGALTAGGTIAMSGPAGAPIYYTVDGRDPRLPGGAVNPAASIYAGPFTPPGATALVRARAFDGAEWSALEEAGYLIGVQVALNEVVARNATTAFDELGQAEDWVELRNLSSVAVDLAGWGLSDDPARPGRWRFPAGATLPAGGYLLVWCDDDETDGPLHASFQLDGEGEAVVLTTPAGDGGWTIDQVLFGPQRLDRPLARVPDGRGAWVQLPAATPLGPNLPGTDTPR